MLCSGGCHGTSVYWGGEGFVGAVVVLPPAAAHSNETVLLVPVGCLLKWIVLTDMGGGGGQREGGGSERSEELMSENNQSECQSWAGIPGGMRGGGVTTQISLIIQSGCFQPLVLI